MRYFLAGHAARYASESRVERRAPRKSEPGPRAWSLAMNPSGIDAHFRLFFRSAKRGFSRACASLYSLLFSASLRSSSSSPTWFARCRRVAVKNRTRVRDPHGPLQRPLFRLKRRDGGAVSLAHIALTRLRRFRVPGRPGRFPPSSRRARAFVPSSREVRWPYAASSALAWRMLTPQAGLYFRRVVEKRLVLAAQHPQRRRRASSGLYDRKSAVTRKCGESHQ